MAGESVEFVRRKHRRMSSVDDADGGSKRRKHRHHDRRHRRPIEEAVVVSTKELGGEKIGEVEIDEMTVESVVSADGGTLAKVLGLPEADYEMEEGEIVEDDELIDFVDQDPAISKKYLDVESGEIETIIKDPSEGVTGVSKRRLHKTLNTSENDTINSIGSDEKDQDMIADSSGFENGYCLLKPRNAGILCNDSKRTSKFVGKCDKRRKPSSLEERRVVVSPSHSLDKYFQESSPSTLSKSPDSSVGRSRSQTIVRETSVENNCYIDGQNEHGSNDRRMYGHFKSFHRSRKDDAMEEPRERTCSKYMEEIEVRHHSRDIDVNEDGRRGGAGDRTGKKEREKNEWEKERERNRLRDQDRWDRDMLTDRSSHREKGREWSRDLARERRGKEKERGRERVTDRGREEMNRDIDNGRGIRDDQMGRSREKDTRRGRDLLSSGRDIESWSRRNSEDDLQSRRNKSEKLSSECKQGVLGDDNIVREDEREEDYEEEIVLQLEEQEEDELEKIKEESRRRRQAILEKYKNHQQENGVHLQGAVKDSGGQHKHDNKVEGKDIYDPESSFSAAKLQNDISTSQMPAGNGGLGEGTPQSEVSDDMFCDDIFGESPAEVHKAGKGDGVAVEKSELHDNWDDAEGYYGYRLGEILNGRFEIIAAQGKGVFSTVVRVKDLKAKSGEPEEVAIKIIRNNETMYKAGMEELVILKKLVGADLEDKRHCVRFLSTFKYRNHLCLVFESLHMNLREVLKKFGRNIGLKLTAVRTYAKQLFIALKHLKNCGVLHCDIKPDNMLVNEAKNVLKLCDFGSAMFAGKNEITPYLVSRFYRAPEIILGLPYYHPLDIWSVGCCLFELYNGKVLFPGATNNDMLRLQLELKGPFPKKMLRKASFTDQHFDPDLNFLATEEDPVSKKTIRRLIVNVKPKDFGTLISASPGEDPKMVANFKDLIEKILVLDPDKRLNVSQALRHPFITGK